LVVLVGTRRAIAIAVKNDRPAQRHTALDARLRGDMPLGKAVTTLDLDETRSVVV